MIRKLKTFISDVDFEMNKVSWPTWDELRGSTYVVITLTLILGLYLFFADLLLSKILSVLL
jgi:preprotein translocase subunit SecE